MADAANDTTLADARRAMRANVMNALAAAAPTPARERITSIAPDPIAYRALPVITIGDATILNT